jgi:hypothetical protein
MKKLIFPFKLISPLCKTKYACKNILKSLFDYISCIKALNNSFILSFFKDITVFLMNLKRDRDRRVTVP